MTTTICTTNTVKTTTNIKLGENRQNKINCRDPLYFALKYIDALIQNVTKTNIPPEEGKSKLWKTPNRIF